MAKAKKLCKLCHTRPAEVPDRYGPPGRQAVSVCRVCHVTRLCRDLERILKAKGAKHAAPGGPDGNTDLGEGP